MTTDNSPDVADIAPISLDEANSMVLRLDGHGRILFPNSHNGKTVQKALRTCSGFIQKPYRLVSLSKEIRQTLEAAQDENS
jgi:hypothetical protein